MEQQQNAEVVEWLHSPCAFRCPLLAFRSVPEVREPGVCMPFVFIKLPVFHDTVLSKLIHNPQPLSLATCFQAH